jgi:hypothetical protein
VIVKVIALLKVNTAFGRFISMLERIVLFTAVCCHVHVCQLLTYATPVAGLSVCLPCVRKWGAVATAH